MKPLPEKTKRIEKLRRNLNDWHVSDFDWLLIEQAGCDCRQQGSHKMYIKRSHSSTIFAKGVCIPIHRPVKPIYAKQAMKYYDELCEEE